MRRKLLLIITIFVLLSISIAGISSLYPGSEGQHSGTPTITESQSFTGEFHNQASKLEITITDNSTNSERLNISYVSSASNQTEFAQEVGRIAVAYAKTVNQTKSKTLNLSVSVMDEGNARAKFMIRYHWALEFTNGRLTPENYTERIYSTYETV